MCNVNKNTHTKNKSGNVSYAPRIYIYIYIRLASEDNGCRLFAYRMYEEFRINLCES